MWDCASRQLHDRRGLRYPSDLTDAEWGLIASLIPPARRGGRPRSVDLRAVVEGLLYLLETGCQWRHLPKDFPPRSTVWAYFDLWSYDGTLARIHEALYVALREAEGRAASPSAAIIDSQTVKSAEKGGPARRNPVMTRARRPRASSAICWSTRSV
jgi:transposase